MSIWLLAGSGGHHGSFGNSDGHTRITGQDYPPADNEGLTLHVTAQGAKLWHLPGVCAQPSTLSPLDLAA